MRYINRLWQVRGAFPGLGATLHAFGLPHGNLLAWHLVGDSEKAIDPWPVFTAALHSTRLVHAGFGLGTWTGGFPGTRKRISSMA